MRLIFLGPPGAGKGTQAARLAEHIGVPHVATGDMMRVARESNTPLGREVREYMDKGDLVPDDLTNQMVRERLSVGDTDDGFILDGYPRTLDQVEALDRVLDAEGVKLDKVVRFMVTGDEIVERLSGRRVCPECNRVYHMTTKPPETNEKCDDDGSSLIQRDDDKPETILRRLEEYGAKTKPLQDVYAERGILVEIDAIGPTDEVFERVRVAVGA